MADMGWSSYSAGQDAQAYNGMCEEVRQAITEMWPSGSIVPVEIDYDYVKVALKDGQVVRVEWEEGPTGEANTESLLDAIAKTLYRRSRGE